jgi:hypothetical protein
VDGQPAVATEYAWSHTEHFQAVVFHDPIAGCDSTIFERVDWLLQFHIDYEANGGLRVTSDSTNFPTCGRMQFDMHRYLENGVLDPYGLISLVVNFGTDCGGVPIPPTPQVPKPIPEPTSIVLVGTGAAFLCARWRRRLPTHFSTVRN